MKFITISDKRSNTLTLRIPAAGTRSKVAHAAVTLLGVAFPQLQIVFHS